ncbi:unnamed protein product [Caenorhabditis auriculariae]|uniref:Uncharacterized protein n=1 Tax=Caenorhabditis auriculariae TaxID=2777116 RepID=A0A8S1HEK4_9PELO|nr:unnamed protein product [Caenorhabditis auriculariae]
MNALHAILAASLMAVAVFACDIEMRLTTQTWYDTYVQVTWFNETKSDVYEFHEDGKTLKLRMKGLICNMKPTIVEVFKECPTTGVKPYARSSTFLEGLGFMEYVILSDGLSIGTRTGVLCSWGDCGAARG